MIANVGDTIKFLCNSDITVEWNFKNGPLPNNALTGRMGKPHLQTWRLQWLILTEVRLENAGLFGDPIDHFYMRVMLFSQ